MELTIRVGCPDLDTTAFTGEFALEKPSDHKPIESSWEVAHTSYSPKSCLPTVPRKASLVLGVRATVVGSLA